jgi:hypothetical protein
MPRKAQHDIRWSDAERARQKGKETDSWDITYVIHLRTQILDIIITQAEK